MRSKEESVMFRRMKAMVDEANVLRDEAAEKLYEVPKAYKLNTLKDEACFYLTIVACLGFALGFMALFYWAMDGEHIGASVFCVAILGVGMIVASIAKNRPHKVEEATEDYFVNGSHYVALVTELERLKAGIADYDRQYEEQKEYISRFESCRAEIEKYGSLKLILKANDFHAQVKITTTITEMNCRLLFDEDGYRRLKNIIELFDNEKSLDFSSDERATH